MTTLALDYRAGVVQARQWARFYRECGFNCLPACVNASRPAMKTYAAERDAGVSEDLLSRWWTPCVQVCTGVRWGLVVLDVDGPNAGDFLDSRCLVDDLPRTWTVSTPSGGYHLWFSIPEDVVSLPKVTLWEEPGVRHSAIELLGDRCLAMAPPSIREHHGGHCGRYRWVDGLSPRDLARPALLPVWVLEWAAGACLAARPLARPLADRERCLLRPRRRMPRGVRFDPHAVIAAIPDPAAVASSWGLRIVSSAPNARGWLRCHAIDREDVRPSASFHSVSGYYSEPFKLRYSLFELGARIGPFGDWRDTLCDLAHRFGVAPCSSGG